MKAETLIKRLSSRYDGSKTAKAYKVIKDLIEGTNITYMVTNNTIRPVITSGHGRFTSNMDYTNDTARILDLLGVKYRTGNDSTRGGLTGNYITILTKIERNK